MKSFEVTEEMDRFIQNLFTGDELVSAHERAQNWTKNNVLFQHSELDDVIDGIAHFRGTFNFITKRNASGFREKFNHEGTKEIRVNFRAKIPINVPFMSVGHWKRINVRDMEPYIKYEIDSISNNPKRPKVKSSRSHSERSNEDDQKEVIRSIVNKYNLFYPSSRW